MASLSLKDLCARYVEWVSNNPQTATEIENSSRWASYLLIGRISNSAVISELVYSISNLIILFNDNIIRSSQPLHKHESAHKLKTWLTVLELSEVFIEVTAFRTWGDTGKWIVIVLIQIFKCVARLLLLYRYKENIVQNPPVPPLKRRELNKQSLMTPPEGFILTSGRVIRTVESSFFPALSRSWKPPVLSISDDKRGDAVLGPSQFLGEVLYITKPLAHLVALFRYGPQNWRPWVIAFAMDLVSLQLLKSCALPGSRLSHRQGLELSRRQISLLLYLLRSPFYESQTRDRLQRLLASCSSTIPLIGIVLRPLAEYIPHWQRTYFYMWSA